MGKHFHPDHFRCRECKQPVKTAGKIYTYQDSPICEGCYSKLVSICCSCSKQITGQVIRALDKKWHQDCFVCQSCRASLQDKCFNKNGMPYCENCFINMSSSPNAVKCAGCNRPIVDKILNALDQTWHINCFACNVCKKPFTEGEQMYEQDGTPYCGEHVPKQRRSLPPRPKAGQPSPNRSNPPPNLSPNHASPNRNAVSPQKTRGGSRRVVPQRRPTGGTAPPIQTSQSQDDGVLLRNAESPRSSRQRPVSMKVPSKPQTNPFTNTKSFTPGLSRNSDPNRLPQVAASDGNPAFSRVVSTPNFGTKEKQSEVEIEAPEIKLSQKIIKDLSENLEWFAQMWAKESRANRDLCIQAIIGDIQAAYNKKPDSDSGKLNVEVKSWAKSVSSLNIEINPEKKNSVRKLILKFKIFSKFFFFFLAFKKY